VSYQLQKEKAEIESRLQLQSNEFAKAKESLEGKLKQQIALNESLESAKVTLAFNLMCTNNSFVS
jgi:hypothetical protein